MSNSNDDIWERFRRGDPSAREDLILAYMPLVNFVAKKINNNLPTNVELDDLVSDGFFGLIDAIEKFEPDRGFQFQTYAVSRIRGEIIDRLRSADWIPRSLRSKFRMVDNATSELELKLQRIPTDNEIANYLNWSLDELNHLRGMFASSSLSALDDVLVTGDFNEKIRLVDTIADSNSDSDNFELLELKDNLARALSTLSQRERVVLILYYFEGLTLQNVGSLLEVTESRVCQIHTKALLSLRDYCILS